MNTSRANDRAGAEAEARRDATPAPDMQPEDTGTPASGTGGRGTAAEAAMKQEHKTGPESGSGTPGERR